MTNGCKEGPSLQAQSWEGAEQGSLGRQSPGPDFSPKEEESQGAVAWAAVPARRVSLPRLLCLPQGWATESKRSKLVSITSCPFSGNQGQRWWPHLCWEVGGGVTAGPDSLSSPPCL